MKEEKNIINIDVKKWEYNNEYNLTPEYDEVIGYEVVEDELEWSERD